MTIIRGASHRPAVLRPLSNHAIVSPALTTRVRRHGKKNQEGQTQARRGLGHAFARAAARPAHLRSRPAHRGHLARTPPRYALCRTRAARLRVPPALLAVG